MSDSLVMSKLGVVAEGQLQHVNGGWVLIDSDGQMIPISERLLQRWVGKRVRIAISDIGRLEQLVELGMTPGKEMEFVAALTEKQVNDLFGDDE